jgi:hypothetical protein
MGGDSAEDVGRGKAGETIAEGVAKLLEGEVDWGNGEKVM